MTAECRPEGFTEPAAVAESEKASAPDTKCCPLTLKMFIGMLGLCFFSKSLTASYTKSTITQIERRFEIPSSTVGVIDGSFEMGNLLVIIAVSYFGAKYHRPKIIGTGALLMALGTFLMAMPHFFMERYKYESMAAPLRTSAGDNTSSKSPCSHSSQNALQQPLPGCSGGEEEGSPLWVVVLLGNVLRGIGEATVGPLGVSFIDDYARTENAAFYIGCLHTIAVIGPLFGYSLGSLCARLYVDIGFVKLDSITITLQDSRWVGAWWLGFLVAGSLSLLAAIPFWFTPRELPEDDEVRLRLAAVKRRGAADSRASNFVEVAKDFLPSLKSLFSNKAYVLYLITNIMLFNAFVVFVTYTAKYFEQQFGQSASSANFLIGVTCMPAVSLGIFFSGLIMKRFKLDVLGAAKLAFWTSLGGYLCSVPFFALSCQNLDVAGLTVPYPRLQQMTPLEGSVVSTCNAGCGCSERLWDPVCAPSGITYASPCFAGCNSTSGSGRNMTFHNCSCVQGIRNSSEEPKVVLGQCPRERNCSKMFYIYLAFQSLSVFVYSLGSVALFIISLRSVEPELKSLSVGVFMMALRVLGGIPAPIYFGALIDSTCLLWGSRRCGGRGACRLYNIKNFRFLFLGVMSCLRLLGYGFFWSTIVLIKKKQQRSQVPKDEQELELNQKEDFNGSLRSSTLEQTLQT